MADTVVTKVDLARIRANARSIRARVGPGVDLIGVVKADAYGLGAVAVADAIADLVSSWYVFEAIEAIRARLFDLTGKPVIATLVPLETSDEVLRDQGIRPAVWTPEAARRFAEFRPLLAVDTGMQRFACPPEELPEMFGAYPFEEAFTHAARPEQADRLVELTRGRGLRLHAAATALLDIPCCRLDAVRPGAALFDGAARVWIRLLDARDSRGPVGYTGFESARHGVIKAGYSDGLRRGPVVVNGRRQQILEVGMQTAYVSLDPADRTGDEVVLLGDGLTAGEVGQAWGASAYEALLRLATMGERMYV